MFRSISQGLFFPCLCQSHTGIFAAFHYKNLAPFLEVKPIKLGSPTLQIPVISHSHTSPHSASNNVGVSPCLLLWQHLHQVSRSQTWWRVCLSPDFRLVVCPTTSVLWLIHTIDFSFAKVFLIARTRVMPSKLFKCWPQSKGTDSHLGTLYFWPLQMWLHPYCKFFMLVILIFNFTVFISNFVNRCC